MNETNIEWADYTWNPIVGEAGYYAHPQGLIRGPRGKVLKPIEEADRHQYVFVHGRKRYVHRLVLETFVGPCPVGMQCRHLDGNPHNNHLDNLAWGTHAENVADRWIHGTMPLPHESKSAKLAIEDIPQIRQLHKQGKSTRAIGAAFGVSHTTVIETLNGERWRGY